MGPVLERARELGLVGPGPVVDHLVHAAAFAGAVGTAPSGASLDLGSGAGLPGLALSLTWPESRWALLEAGDRRCEFLGRAVDELGVGDRVEVVRGRAEELGRDDSRRGRFELVTARSFGAPATTAECASPFLRPGGRLVVSEPPDPDADRWPESALSELGLRVGAARRVGEANFQVLEQVEPCPTRFPRRQGVPRKRPLFG